jgi:hypothetical protein
MAKITNSTASAADVAIAAPTAPRNESAASKPNFNGTSPITEVRRITSRRWAYRMNVKIMMTVRNAAYAAMMIIAIAS